MKLNPDCIRDVLLYIEERSTFNGYVKIAADGQLGKYELEEISYHVKQCALSDLIVKYRLDLDENISVEDLHPNGHQFLANIRENKIWNGVKEVAGKVGSSSLSALTQIASGIVTTLIKAHYGLN